MKKIALAGCSLFALTAGLFISQAVAQNPQFPQTLPPNTVVGRTGIVAGPAQAIPINILTGSILLAISGDCAATISGTVTCTINDRTAIAGNGASKWSPLFFGNTGTGRVSRFNRIFCGEATASSSDTGPVTTKDWLESLLANTTGVAQIVCVDTTGQLGVLGASRASDFRTVFGTSTGGAQGVTGLGYNDDAVGGAIAVGVNGIGVQKSGAVGISAGYQGDSNNAGSVVDIDPSLTGIPNGATPAGILTSGAYSGLGTNNTTAALIVALGRTGGPKHRQGITFLSNALDTAAGGGGGGLAMHLFRGQSLRWRNSTPTTDTEVWGNASGFNIASNALITGNITSQGTITTGTNGGTGGFVTLNGSTSGSWTLTVTASTSTANLGSVNLFADTSGDLTSNANISAVNLVSTSTFFTQTPATLTGTSGSTSSTSQIINPSGGAFTLTLPNPATFPGRWLYIKEVTTANTISSASSNVVPRAGTAAGTAILASGTGNWTALQSDGTNWISMMGTP